VAALYPTLPASEMTSIQFTVCSLLVEEPKSFGIIRQLLKKMGWKSERPNGTSTLLRRLQRAGLVVSEPFNNGDRLYRLTQLGLNRLKAANTFNTAAARQWGGAIDKAVSDRFPAERAPIRDPKKERAATDEEFAKIVGASSEAFSRILRFSRLVGLRVYDVANAQIDGLSTKKKLLQLEEKSLTGRPIRDRFVPLSDEASQFVQDAIGSRKEGFIFLNAAGKPWGTGVLSRNFQLARERAGLSPELVMSGRGGNVFKRAERVV